MSRIHTILEKAERDGTLGRLGAATTTDVPLPILSPEELQAPFAPARPPADVDARHSHHVMAPVDLVYPEEPSIDAPVVPGHEAEPIVPAESPWSSPDESMTAPVQVHAHEPAPAPQEELAANVIPPEPVPARLLASSLVAAREPHALVSEQFRALRTRLTHSINGRGARVLLVTSPGRREGKSTVAANLALTMGQEIRQRICLVDASLRQPSLHTMFGLSELPGLSDVLAGRLSLEAALVTLEPYQLTLLPAGPVPNNPAELLGGTDMRRVVALLRSRFDRVVIDGAATAPTADVGTLLPLVDGALIVARAGVTATPALTQAVAAIGSGHVLGVVLNDTEA